MTSEDPEHTRKGNDALGRSWLLRYITAQVVLIVLGNAVTLGFSQLSTSSETEDNMWYAESCAVAEAMGLKPGQQYEVEAGARVSGSEGSGYFWSALFGSAGHVNFQAASSLSIGFDYNYGDNRSSIFEIPISKISFVKDSSAIKPKMSLYLKCMGSYKVSQRTHYGPQCTVMNSLIFGRWHDIASRDPLVLEPDVVKAGLSPIVRESLSVAEIRVTPELYAKILGVAK